MRQFDNSTIGQFNNWTIGQLDNEAHPELVEGDNKRICE